MSKSVSERWRRMQFVGLAVLATFMLCLVPARAESNTDEFDADDALIHATVLSATIGERVVGSEGEYRSTAWLAAVLVNLGYTVEVQPFTFVSRGEARVGMNVVAVKEGQPGYGTIYVGAHHDTAPNPFNGPGANDNAAGVSVMLEAADVLANQEISPTIKFIAFGAEELGLAGSERYAEDLPSEEKMTAIGMLNLDCVGIGEQLQMHVIQSDDLDFAQSLAVDADKISVNLSASSDHHSFARVGIPAVLFSMRDPEQQACGPNYHSADDTIDTLESEAIQRVGTNLVTAIQGLSEQAEFQAVWRTYLPVVSN